LPKRLIDRPLALLTAFAALLLLGLLWTSPVHRTQEARVLVTAREMEDSGWHGWMIPKTNGHVRLRQPPLAYWATAASYKVLGVGIVHGRLPAALAGEGSAKKDKEKHEFGRMKQLEEWPPPVRGVRTPGADATELRLVFTRLPAPPRSRGRCTR